MTVVQHLIDNAARWTARNKIKGRILFDVDPSILIIEDGSGALVYSTGDLSFLMSCDPEIGEDFASQLGPEYQDQYRQRQLAVWDLALPELENFKTKHGREAAMFELYANKGCYTFTVFNKA